MLGRVFSEEPATMGIIVVALTYNVDPSIN